MARGRRRWPSRPRYLRFYLQSWVVVVAAHLDGDMCSSSILLNRKPHRYTTDMQIYVHGTCEGLFNIKTSAVNTVLALPNNRHVNRLYRSGADQLGCPRSPTTTCVMEVWQPRRRQPAPADIDATVYVCLRLRWMLITRNFSALVAIRSQYILLALVVYTVLPSHTAIPHFPHDQLATISTVRTLRV